MSIKQKSVAVLAGLAVFAIVSASAATLGGLDTNDLGANSNGVKAQTTGGVGVSWDTTYDATVGGYVISGVTLSPAAHEDAEVKITLKASGGAALAEITGTGDDFDLPVTPIAARDVFGVSLVINGGTVTAAVDATK